MDGLGDLFGSIGEMLGGLTELAAERGGEMAVEATVGAFVGGGESGEDAAVFSRILTGGRRALNVNDL